MGQDILNQLNLSLNDLPEISGRERTRLLYFLLRWEYIDTLHACLDVLIPKNPTLVSLLDMRARAFLAQEQPGKALPIMQQRLQMRTSMTAQAMEARIYLAKGDAQTAHTLAQKIVAANPDKVTAWSTLGDIQLSMGKIEAAFQSYRHIAEQSPNSRRYILGMVEIYAARADWVTASGYATRLLRIAEEEGPLPISTLQQLRTYFKASEEITRVADIDAELAHRRAEELAEMQMYFAEEEEEELDRPTAPSAVSAPPPAPDFPPSATSTSVQVSEAERAHIATKVKALFGFTSLQPGQLETLACALRGEDVLAVLPTGGGKSLCYQLPALLEESGTTFVISPLIALMKDQIESLPDTQHAHATMLNSSLTGRELRQRMMQVAAGRYKLVYAAPERLRQPPFLHILQQADITRLVIDEAHCVSVWGHDFRPDYLIIKRVREALGNPHLMAVTATAPPRVRRDILQQLGDMQVVTGDSTRPNLRFEVFYASSNDEKLAHIIAFCKAETGSGIIYAGTRKRCERLAALLRKYGISAAHYHAGIPNRAAVQDAFMSGETRIIVATIAFGMGIDKADVRFIVHFSPPDSLESYYQEAGRAGRDGQPSRCLLMYASSDRGMLTRHAHQGVLPVEYLRAVYAAVKGQLNGATLGVINTNTIIQSLQTDDIAFRVALSMLEEAELLYRGPDLPRAFQVQFLQETSNAAPAPLTALAQMADAHAPFYISLPDIIHQTDLSLDTIEPALLTWVDEGWLNYTSGPRDISIAMLSPPANAAERVARLLERYEAIQIQRVDEISAYAETSRCRHGHINAYLGGQPIEHCTNCDNCVEVAPPPPAGFPDEAAQYQAILRLLNGTYGWGRASLTAIMQGAADAPAKAQQHKDFGALAFRSKSAIGKLIRRLEKGDFIRAQTLSHGGVALNITPKGQAAIQNANLLDKLVGSQRSSRRKRRRKRRAPSRPRQVTLSGEEVTTPDMDEALFNALKDWRLALAQENKVPVYIIFPNKTLSDIATYKPTTLNTLESIKGVGPRKIEKYGHAVIELVKKHL